MSVATAAPTTTILNISELSRGFGLDRATVKKRIDAARIEPVDRKANETRYRLDAQLQEILLAVDADLEAEKLRKLTAEANLKEMEVAVKQGELAPVAEFQELVQILFGGLYKEITVRFPKRVAARMARTKLAGDASAILQRELNRIFVSVRNDFSKYLDKEDDKPAKPKPKARAKTKTVPKK